MRIPTGPGWVLETLDETDTTTPLGRLSIGCGRPTPCSWRAARWRKQYGGIKSEEVRRLKALVIGNSYARDLLNSVEECDALPGWEISYVPIRALKSLSTLEQSGAWPEVLAKRLKNCDLLLIAQGDIPIFVSDDWPHDRQVLKSMGARNILVIGTKNFGWNPNCIMAMGTASAVKFRPLVEQQSWDWNQRDLRTFSPDYVDLLALLCDHDGRVSLFTQDGKLISEDGRHLTPPGARFVGQLIFSQPSWKQMVKAAADSAAIRTKE